jgi:hypothetical protein
MKMVKRIVSPWKIYQVALLIDLLGKYDNKTTCMGKSQKPLAQLEKNPITTVGRLKVGRSVSQNHLKQCACNLTLWPWKYIGFQILLRSKYVPSLVKIHWRMLILECSQGCYAVKFDLWPWKSIGFQTLLRTMYVPSLVKIHWRMLITECSQGCYAV